jgi:hypothetical protein
VSENEQAAPESQPAADEPKKAAGEEPKAAEEEKDNGSPDKPDEPNSEDAAWTASATDQPGRASSHEQDKRRAQEKFGGDWVGGHKFVFHLADGLESSPLRPFPESLATLVREAFVSPDGWDEFRVDFHRHYAVVLSGTPGHGRVTMAVRLLQTVETRAIYDLDPHVDLTRMAERLSTLEIEHGTAFLLRDPEAIASLDSYTLESLETALTAAKARLVITVGSEAELRDEGLMRFRLNLPPAPKLRDVLFQHLAHQLDEARAESLLAHTGIEALVAEQLDSGTATCELTVSLAQLLSDAVEPFGEDLVSQLRMSLRRNDRERFERWFDQLEDLELRCFAIALAVLDGLSYEDVSDAAHWLYDRLTASPTEEQAARPPFRFSASRLCLLLRAVLKPDEDGAETLIRYRSPDFPRLVLERAWRGYQIQGQLRDWLKDLVVDGSDAAKTCAGTALGVLATFAYDYVRRHILVPWSLGKNGDELGALADAIDVVARAPALHDKLVSLVNGWYADLEKPQRQATAALILGTRFGRAEATRSFARLERLAMIDHLPVHICIGRGVAGLLVERPDLTAQMYAMVWRCLADRRRSMAGRLTFLVVANDLHTTGVTAANGSSGTWPTLLHLADRDSELRVPLFELWARVLTEGSVLDSAHKVLRNWAGLADGNDDLLVAFTRMARAISALDQRAGASIGRLARIWGSDDELVPLANVAAEISTVIPS